MIVIGLTGGIGAGKSTAAKILSKKGLPVYSADAAVHKLLGKGGAAVRQIEKLFPGAVKKGAVDRQALGKIVFSAPKKLKQLERILHPLVRKTEAVFLVKARKKGAKAAVLEIPLLFETGAEKRCDTVIVVTAPLHVRKARVLERKGMTAAKFKAITRQQMTDAEKRRRADHIVPTADGLAQTRTRLGKTLKTILQRS